MKTKNVKRAIKKVLGLESTQEKFKRHIRRWFRHKGDETLRLEYPLTADSIVWDVGGYHGDFAEKMVSLYGCKVYVFEPLEKFFAQCEQRFAGNPKIRCFNYGLAAKEGWFDISDEADASSFDPAKSGTATVKARLRPVSDVFRELGDNRIDLLKVNIEGGEFDLLPAMIDSGIIGQVDHIQVQFHTFVASAEEKRNAIRKALKKTHKEKWCYFFVWESWFRKPGGVA